RGKYLVSFTARDPEGALAQQSAEITVAGVNHAPQLEVPAAQTVNEGGLLVFQLQTTDEDGDAVDVAAAGLPENAVFIAATNTMTFAPEYGQQGQYQVSFSATDGLLSSAPVTVDITVLDVQPGQGGQPTELILEVDQVQNPTLLTTARISGAVNGGGGLPPVQQPVSALINTVSPAQAEQGASLEVELKSTDALFPAHFAQGQSQVNFGAGITVNAVSVLSSGQLKAAITIDSSAAPGIRAISVQTGNETAVSLVAFRVVRGRAIITGLLRDPETGAALPGAMVGIQGTGIQVVSGADGRFTLFDVPAGRQTLLVNAPDHQFFTLEIDAQLGETTDTGTIGSSATVFDPTAPAAASLVSVLGRGAARSISTLSKEGLRQLIIDTLILTGGDEGGVVDEYGNQLNPSVNGESLISVTLKGVDVLADRLLKDESFALVDLLFSAAHGYEWGGILGRPLTLDELLAIIQQQVNAAWADPLNPENALALVVFNPGTTVTPQPPVIDRTTRLNALQMYILASSLLIDMQWRMDNLQASAAGQNSTRRRMLAQLSELFLSNAYAQIRPPGRYTRFWRGGFNDSYATAMIKQGTQVLAETAALFALLPAGGLAGANFGSHIAGRYGTDMTAMMMALQTSLRVPEAPKII
ncbi:MAG TPA: carboxypeptidase regulatory-like domain-containing protein, partial [Oligoflexia bacterium]|nr:carboxypeptidase regulatory-like domain-containing protein [Oligoflexia bacterium]